MQDDSDAEHICVDLVKLIDLIIVCYDLWCYEAWSTALCKYDMRLVLVGCETIVHDLEP